MRLYLKFLFTLLAIIGLTAGGILWYSDRAVHGTLIEQRLHLAVTETDDLARRAGDLRGRPETELLPLLLRVQREAGAQGVYLLDPQGRIFAHTNVVEKGRREADGWGLGAFYSEGPLYREREGLLDIAVPFRERLFGRGEEFLLDAQRGARRIAVVRLQIPLDATLLTQSDIHRGLRGVVLIGAGLAAIAAFILIGRMLQPLRRLAIAATRIGRGDYGVRIGEASSDELGDLARSFDKMAEDLSRTTVSKAFLDRILENIGDMIVVCDPRGRVQLANRAVQQTLGYPEEELLGRPAEALGRLGEGFRWEDCGRTTENLETVLVRKDGGEVPVLLSAAPLRGADGSVQGLIVTARDIRERKRFEQQLRTTEKLSAVGRLAAGVAHEINNPLGVILGFAQSAVRRLPAQDPLTLPLSSIEREAQRCRTLIQDLLTFSRHERAAQSAPLLLESLFSMTAPIVETVTRAHGIRLDRSCEAGVRVHGDINQLQQVLINLCGNAVDAMPEGGTLSLRGGRGAGDEEGRGVIEVSDTGPGVPEEIREKVFEPFFTTKPPGKGTGLGLALVHEIVTRHRGSVQLRSVPGKGATFRVLLPLAGADASGEGRP